MHDSAVAIVRPRARASARTCSSTERSSREKIHFSSGSAIAALESRRSLLRARLDDEVDVDLELARADRHLDAVAVSPGLFERAGDRGLAQTEQAEDAAVRRRRPRQKLPNRLARERVRPEPLQLGRRSGQDDDDASVRSAEDEARRGSGEADRGGRNGTRRLLPHARLEVGVRPPQSLGDRARDGADLLLELLVDDELEPGRARDHLDGAVVVRRAEPTGDEARVGFQAFSERRFELDGVVADDRDPRGLEAVAKRLGGEEWAVPVSPLAADELAAGGDDRRPRARGHPPRTVTPGECVMWTPAGLRAAT